MPSTVRVEKHGILTLLKMKLKLMDRRKIQEMGIYDWQLLARKLLIKKEVSAHLKSQNKESDFHES
jgi:hypothetical protein